MLKFSLVFFLLLGFSYNQIFLEDFTGRVNKPLANTIEIKSTMISIENVNDKQYNMLLTISAEGNSNYIECLCNTEEDRFSSIYGFLTNVFQFSNRTYFFVKFEKMEKYVKYEYRCYGKNYVVSRM